MSFGENRKIVQRSKKMRYRFAWRREIPLGVDVHFQCVGAKCKNVAIEDVVVHEFIEEIISIYAFEDIIIYTV